MYADASQNPVSVSSRESRYSPIVMPAAPTSGKTL